MSRIGPAILSAWLCLSIVTPAKADDLEWSLISTAGYSSNVFDSPEQKADRYALTGTQLRGTIGHDDRKLAFGLSLSQKRLAKYRFGNERLIEAELAYRRQLNERTRLVLEAAFGRQDGGDLLASIGGIDIGYRALKTRTGIGGSLTTASEWGSTAFTASYRSLTNGKAAFNQPGLTSVRLEPQQTELAVGLRHDLPVGHQIFGLNAFWKQSLVPQEDRDVYVRYPAQTTGLSALWTLSFGKDFSLQTEAGSAMLMADELGGDARWYPRYSAQAVWAVGNRFTISAGIGRSLQLTEIDDAVAEDVAKGVIRLTGRLTDALEAELAWEHSANHQIYFDYPARSRTWSAGLAWKFTDAMSAKLSFASERHSEEDPALDYTKQEVTASLSARF